ncbi:hypothetical protein ACIRPT_02570 [Streptomyces sp. NPDC101227]|uniref:hypothetical protein n=1 Tax=Streptomyces sp. NPDC101227 TaxID=3366136 RepID=UPI00380EA7A1
MAWTAPYTATLNGQLSAANFNATVRDNLLLTEAGLAPSTQSDPEGFGTWYFVGTGTNAIAARRMKSDDANWDEQSTTSSSYTSLRTYGPGVTLTTGTQAIVMISASMGSDTANAYTAASFKVSGASTIAASDEWALENDGIAASGVAADNMPRRSMYRFLTGLTAGTNTFTMQYRASGGTGFFNQRSIIVWPL